MNSKRSAREDANSGYSIQSTSSTSGLISSEIQSQLASLGPRIRKGVSDGHRTAGSNLPSFHNQYVIGPVDSSVIEARMAAARPYASMNDAVIPRQKRGRDAFEDEADETYGDTEEDDPSGTPQRIGLARRANTAFFVPTGYRARSRTDADDFEEADFLRPR